MINVITIRELREADLWTDLPKKLIPLLAQQTPGRAEALVGVTESVKHISLCFLNEMYYPFIAVNASGDEEKIVGIATVFIQRNMARWIAEIHDVVVDKDFRGHGLGKKLVQTAIDRVQKFADNEDEKVKLYLTCRPERIAANAMYQSMGFIKVAAATGEWGTNLYKMLISPQASTK